MTTRSTRRSQRSRQYPLGTIATYGPDNTFATKLVASVIERPGQPDPPVMRTWATQTVDVRTDPTIAADVAAFLGEYGVTQTAASDRIIGCPHQEGIDYPMGRACPHCPFWAGIDRLTHEPVSVPAPTMSAAEILDALANDVPAFPIEALTSADGHRDALVEPLLAAIDRAVADPEGASPTDANLFSYALYLLAKWRDVRAYPHVVRWLSLPGEGPFDIGGDIVTQDAHRILAAVCDGDLAPIKALILDRGANEYARGSGMSALALLAAWAEVPREPVVEFFLWLAREGLEREPGGFVWSALTNACLEVEAVTVFTDLRKARQDELIDEMFFAPHELDEAEALPAGQMLEETRSRYPPIEDVAVATAWWARTPRFDDDDDGWADDGNHAPEVQQPYRAPAKVGRNQPCPCGSGKKYKKCCLR